jgi:chromate reductase
MSSLRLLGLVGSARKGSLNRALLRAIGEELPADVALTPWDRLTELRLFHPDLDDDEPATDLKAAIAAADGLLIVSPEYNYSTPALLKNALEWASRPPKTSPLRDKPVGIASASPGISGGMRGQYHLRETLLYSNSPVMVQPEVIIPRAHERFDEAGRLVDASTRELLRRYGAALAAWVRHTAPTRG